MKYWNKTKKFREIYWTRITVDFQNLNKSWIQLKIECQCDGSRNRFYTGNYTRDLWFFENKEDALAFKLKYGYKSYV